MNICIVTVFDSYNSGSFWQAYILSKILERNNCNVYFLKRNFWDNIKLKYQRFCKLIGVFFLNGYEKYKKQLSIYKDFNNIQKKFNIISNSELNNIDLVVIGSDTLWNINSKFFKRNYKLFFGGKLINNKQVTYAVSVANASYDDIKKLKDICNMVTNFNYISVRDEPTYEIANKLTNSNIYKVCDPTMLYSKSDYAKLVKKLLKEKYIFLYLFDELTVEEQIKLKQYAKKNNLKIVSGVKSNSYSDICVNNEPQSFLDYMYNAEYVITDTFHGAIFSINLNKNFVALDRNKKKVNNLLEHFSLINRLSGMPQTSFVDLLNEKINYDEVNKIIDIDRKNSLNYIQMIIENNN